MPTLPKVTTKAVSDLNMQNVVNAVRNDASDFFKSHTLAVANQADLRVLYAQMQAYDSLTNEFMSILWSRIAKVIITSKLFRNPLGFLKKGEVELGEVIEEAFINPAKPHIYDEEGVPDEATLRREPGEIYSAFYIMNYKVFYKTTVFNDNMRTYFLSWDGLERLIAKMTESLYNGAYQDEYMVTKYMIARKMLTGDIASIDVGDYNNDPTTAIVKIKQLSNDLTFIRTKYNEAGVKTYTNKNEQYFLITSAFDALESVEVQASAFNLDKVQFMGQRVMVDDFSELDWERMDILFKNDPNYKRFTSAEIATLKKVAGVIIDRDYLQIYDNLNKMTEQYNSQKLFWNYFLQIRRTFANSPFANAVALVNGEPTINSVTVTPTAVTLKIGTGIVLNAEVDGDGILNGKVNWTSNNPAVTVNAKGYVYVTPDATAGTAVITATSVQDPEKSGSATITITAN